MTDKWLVVGLGNPGAQYQDTRHNIGFRVLEAYSQRYLIEGRSQSKFKAIVGTGMGPNRIPVVLAQPTTFMNLSGEAVQPLLQFYQIPLNQCLVIYDDAALPLGTIRIRSQGSAGGQNGMKSIIQSLGGQDGFPRLRIGIGAPARQEQSLSSHVLSRFLPAEEELLQTVLTLALDAVDCLLTDGIELAMSRYNQQISTG